MEIKAKTVLITGSTGKLTKHVVLALAEAGADCICHYHQNASTAGQLVSQIQSSGRKAVAIQADLAGQKGIESLFEQADKFGRAAVLINSASIFEKRSLKDIDFSDAQKTFALNLASPIVVCRYFAERVRQNSAPAKIINIIDIAAEKPWADYCLYCASKAGLAAATKSMAKELAPHITVNAVAPGLIDWPEGTDSEEKKQQLRRIPAGRAGRADEVASAVKFLLSNDYITGRILNVDGGRSI